MNRTTILIIDDSREILENTAEILDLEGYIVLTAENGKKGIELASKNHPALILCDIMMAELDGYDVLKAVQKDPDTADIPFVFMTAKTEKSEIKKGMSSGANAYLSKPYTVEALLKVVDTLINKETIQRITTYQKQ